VNNLAILYHFTMTSKPHFKSCTVRWIYRM